MRLKWFALLAACVATFSVAGCGGGDSSHDPVIRGTITSVGPNSITVNGVQYDTSAATIVMDDPADPATLSPGMVVTIIGEIDDPIRGRAVVVRMADDLKGPISVFNNMSSSMTVLGHTVRVDPATTVFSNFSGGTTSATSKLAAGEMVRVSGLVDPTGTVHASFVQRTLPDWTPTTPVTITGTLTAPPTSTTFNIGALTVNYSGTTLPTGTTTGSLVKATGTIPTLTSTTLTATRVQAVQAGIQHLVPSGEAETEGYVTGLSGNTFTVDGTPVNAGVLPLTGVANGSKVVVHGNLSNGVLLATSVNLDDAAYRETILVSNIPGLAATTDSNLVNPWGLARSPTGAWWVGNNGTGTVTVYNGVGQRFPTSTPIVVTVPAAAGVTTPAPVTGVVFNNFTGFNVTPGDGTTSARFIFVTESGTISAWNAGTAATLKFNNFSGSKAVYKGATQATNAGSNLLYATDFRGGKVDVFDSNFAPVTLANTSTGAPFTVPNTQVVPPAGYAPFNIVNMGGKLYVTYALRDATNLVDDVAGEGHGFVAVFNPDGSYVRSLQGGLWFNSPWGIALAPADFGKFSGMLLVGNFGSGQIAAFNPTTGAFTGLLRDAFDDPIKINGLWSLGFGNGGNGGPTNTLFFTAGLNDEADGVFGTLTPSTGQREQIR